MVSTKVLIDLLQKCGVPPNESVTTILTDLRKIALLIRGHWTIKSEELYPENSISSHFGLSFEVMRFLRDYIVRYYISHLILIILTDFCLYFFNNSFPLEIYRIMQCILYH